MQPARRIEDLGVRAPEKGLSETDRGVAQRKSPLGHGANEGLNLGVIEPGEIPFEERFAEEDRVAEDEERKRGEPKRAHDSWRDRLRRRPAQ
jgi:hypothetical protein